VSAIALVAKRMTSAPIRLAPVFPPTEERDGLTASKAGYAMLLIYLWIVQAYYCRPRYGPGAAQVPPGEINLKYPSQLAKQLFKGRPVPVCRATQPERCPGPPIRRSVPGRPAREVSRAAQEVSRALILACVARGTSPARA
jgi:hypothetical protein